MAKLGFHLIAKYKSAPITVRAAFWFTVCGFISQAVSFITTPIFTRLMTSDEYGVWTLYTTWSSVIMVIVTLNLQGGGFNNAMLKYEGKRASFLSSMVGLAALMCAIWAVIFYIFRWILVKVTRLPFNYLLIMLGLMLLNQISALWSQEKRYSYNYRPLVLITAISSVLVPIVSVLFVLRSDDKVFGRLTGNLLVAMIFNCTIGAIIVFKGKTVFNKEYWRFVLKFNIPLVPHYLSQIALASSDRIMISNMCGESYAAYYGISYNIATVITILLNSVLAALIPWTYQKLKEQQYREIPKIENALALMFAALALIPILIGPEVVAIMAPKEYQAAVWVIPPVSSSVYFVFLYGIYSNIEFYYEEKKLVAVGSIATAILNIALNFVFIRRFGFIAAGYTTLACYIIYSVCHFLFTKRVLSKRNIHTGVFDHRVLLLIGIGVIVVGIGSNLLYLNRLVRYVFLVLLLIAGFLKRRKIMDTLRTVR